jgi:hypothetical protein
MRCHTKKTPSSSVIPLKKTRTPAALFRMCLLLKIALQSVPLASSPASIQRGTQVFTIVRRGMSGFNPSRHRTRRFCCPLQKGNQEPGSLMLPGFFLSMIWASSEHALLSVSSAGRSLFQQAGSCCDSKRGNDCLLPLLRCGVQSVR